MKQNLKSQFKRGKFLETKKYFSSTIILFVGNNMPKKDFPPAILPNTTQNEPEITPAELQNEPVEQRSPNNSSNDSSGADSNDLDNVDLNEVFVDFHSNPFQAMIFRNVPQYIPVYGADSEKEESGNDTDSDSDSHRDKRRRLESPEEKNGKDKDFNGGNGGDDFDGGSGLNGSGGGNSLSSANNSSGGNVLSAIKDETLTISNISARNNTGAINDTLNNEYLYLTKDVDFLEKLFNNIIKHINKLQDLLNSFSLNDLYYSLNGEIIIKSIT